ncbi:protein FAM166C B-like [Homalodisca vitripennis]|uniref:protein FAM166C B-like n=1 Tax=Homalodisca vitripennis TaxID=197043 RepID=UPI001EE9C865|nr:protein FAM166C B-like [Homalodisca vitripennis]KAG8256897.1 hypothetical protein J6590_060560 [Homalodisca vitripennis]
MAPMDFPPPTLHVFMGSYAPINQGFGSLYQTENTNFFQNYRNETLSRFAMPTYHWGYTRTPYSPRADLVGAYRKANWKKLLETPSVKVRLIDEARSQEVDDFYKLCQMHRDQYKDHTGRLHPLRFFQNADTKWNAPNLTQTYLEFPTKFVEYKKPPVLPKTYARSVPLPILPGRTLAGRYYQGSDNFYNR